jgi:glutamate racemase
MRKSPIGVFDSGVGGLSVLREIRAALPGEDLHYVADSGFAPYGDRPSEFILQRAEAIVDFFISQKVKAIVVACNTATAVAVQTLRARHTQIIVAMEPAVKPAAAITKSGIIGILATSRTLASESFSRLTERHGQGVQVLLQACPGLVEQVEKAELSGPATEALITRYVASLRARGADTLVLGCTHYPFLSPVIQTVAGPEVAVIDPSAAVARELQRRLQSGELLSSQGKVGTEQFWTSGVPTQVQPVLVQLWGRTVEVSVLPLEYSVR